MTIVLEPMDSSFFVEKADSKLWMICVDDLRMCVVSVCVISVCVSHPFSKGFPRSHLSTVTEAGGQRTTDRHCPTKTLSARGEAMRDAALCTCSMNFCARCPLFWFAFGNIVQQYCLADPCTFPFPHLPSQRGN